MLLLFEVLVFYFGLAVSAVGLVWLSIGQKGFVGLEDTDSPLARLFRNRKREGIPIPPIPPVGV